MKASKVVSEAEGYVTRWQGILGLQNWRVTVTARAQPESDAVAVATWAANYRSAEIEINLAREDKQLTGEKLSHHMLHEMLHLLFAPLGDAITVEVAGATKRLLDIQEEVVVDTLANIVWRLTK